MKYFLLTRDGLSLELDEIQAFKLINYGKDKYREEVEVVDKLLLRSHIFYNGDVRMFIISCIDW